MNRTAAAVAAAFFVAPNFLAAQTVRGVIGVQTGAPMPAFAAPAALSASVPVLTVVALNASLSATPLPGAPVPVAALATLPAAAAAAKPATLPAAPPRPVEEEAAKAAATFDGSSPAPAAVEPVIAPAAPPTSPLGAGLRMARAEHDAWLGLVVGLLSGSRTGRRVLNDIDVLAARRGRPILLDVKPIGNNGEFRYDSDMLIMDTGHLKRDPFQSAPILAHELQHVLQRALELPVDALELEIESYTVESRVWSELGVEPAAGSFARDARRRLTKDVPSFVAWLGKQYKNNIALYGSTMDAYVEKLEKNLVKARKAEAKTRKKIVALERVLESMKKNGMSDEAIEAHRREDMEPLERSLRDGAVNRGWIERDLLRLKEPAIRSAFRDYARGVIRRARSLSRP